MQVASTSSPLAKYSSDDDDDDGGLEEDISRKLSELEFAEDGDSKIRKLERSWSQLEESVEEGEEFSFSFVNAQGSPITADEAFQDGEIRPVFPLFNRDIQNDAVSVTDDDNLRPRLRKLFVEDRDSSDGEAELEPSGAYCSWSGGRVEEASPETCKKSNSTGFSKLWRFRDLVMRSNSDGRDAFVFLNDKTRSSSSSPTAPKLTNEDDDKNILTEEKKGKDKTTTTKSAHEKLYMRNRAMRAQEKHRSYLPYKQVGFFTNVNGLSRNIHPF